MRDRETERDLKKFLFYLRESMNWGEWQIERESQAGSTLSTEPDVGLIPQPRDHDLSQNQESDTQPTEPPKCPKREIFNNSTVKVQIAEFKNGAKD